MSPYEQMILQQALQGKGVAPPQPNLGMALDQAKASLPNVDIGAPNYGQIWPLNVFNNPNDPLPSWPEYNTDPAPIPWQMTPTGGMANTDLGALPQVNFGQPPAQPPATPQASPSGPGWLDALNPFAGSGPTDRPVTPGNPADYLKDLLAPGSREPVDVAGGTYDELLAKKLGAGVQPPSASFDVGSMPPAELFQTSMPGLPAPVDYDQFAGMIPKPERRQRQVAPAPDYAAADAALAASGPGEFREDSSMGNILQGLARGGFAGANSDSTGEFLLQLALGGLGGYGQGMEENEARRDVYADKQQDFQGRKAGYEAGKAENQRGYQQEGYDASFDADSSFDAAQRAYAGDVIGLKVKDAEATNDYNLNAAQLRAGAANADRQNKLKLWEMSQPDVQVTQAGLAVTSTDPATGKRTMKFDTTPWQQMAQVKAQLGGAASGDELELINTYLKHDDSDAMGPLKDFAGTVIYNPMVGEQVLGEEALQQIQMKAQQVSAGNEKLYAQSYANMVLQELNNRARSEDPAVSNSILTLMQQFGHL